MARINIEDGLFREGRFLRLVASEGVHGAMGSLVMAWIVAQKYWFPLKRLIPVDVWKTEGLNDALVTYGFAQVCDEGYYINGSEEKFQWIFDAKEKGKKGGERSAASKKAREVKPKPRSTKPKHRSTTGQPQVEILASNSSTANPLNSSLLSLNSSLLPQTPNSLPEAEDVDEVRKVSHEEKANQIGVAWNIMASENKLTKVLLPLSADRVELLRVPLAEFSTAEDWSKIIAQVPINPYNTGDNDRNWKADFEWLLRKTKFNYRKLWEEYESQNS